MSETHQAYPPVTQDEIDAWLESDGTHLSRYHARRLIVDLEAAKLREAEEKERADGNWTALERAKENWNTLKQERDAALHELGITRELLRRWFYFRESFAEHLGEDLLADTITQINQIGPSAALAERERVK